MEFSLVNLLAVLVAAWVCGSIAVRFGYPSILGELLAGVIFGPALLGWLDNQPGLHVLAEVGVYLLMLYIGMQVDHRELSKASWPGLMAATGGFVVPFGAGYAMTLGFGGDTTAALFMGLAMGVTALATKSRILADLNLFGTRVANVTLAAALISDTVALIIFSAIITFAKTGQVSVLAVAMVLGKVVLFFAVTFLLGLKVFPFVGSRLMAAGFRQRTANFTLLLLVGLVFAEFAELAGLHSILGAFIAGLFVREGVLRRKLSHEISSLVHDLSIGFLAPIFFVVSGFYVDLAVFQTDLVFLISVIVVATVSKIVGSTLFYLPTGRNWREGLTAGMAMNGRGAVEIILAQLGLEMGIIDQTTFSVLVLMAFFTTATVPVFLKWAVSWLERRGELDRDSEDENKTLIFGAGPLGIALARVLAQKDEVTLIDRNREHCQAAEKAGFRVLNGDALSYESIEDAGASSVHKLIAISSNADVNTLVAQFVRENFRVPAVFALIPSAQEEGMRSLLEEQGIVALTSEVPLEDWERWLALGVAHVEELQVIERMSFSEASDTWYFGRQRLPLAVATKDAISPVSRHGVFEPGDRIFYVRRAAPDKKEGAPRGDRFDDLVASADIIDLEGGTDKDALLKRLANLFSPRLGISEDEVRAGLYRRESEGSTALAPGIAVPHVELGPPGKLELIVVRARDGIVFDPDEPPVVAAFAIAASRDERTAYLRVLSAIAQILHSPTFAQRWLELDGVEGIREFLRTAKRQRF